MTVPSELETATTQALELQENGSPATESQDENSTLDVAASSEEPTASAVEPDDVANGLTAIAVAEATPTELAEAATEMDQADAETEMVETTEDAIADSEETSADGAGPKDPVEPQSYDDELPDEVEMSLFDHLEELRQRIFVSLIAVVIGAIASFAFVKNIVRLLEVPAQGVKFLQLAPGEFFFVSIKVAGYCGILLATPVILYEIAAFVVPGLTRKERRVLGPVVFGSSILFVGGLAFAYIALIPAALNFFITYGADVVEQSWSIEKYFDFVLLLMLSTGLAFQVPIIQALLGMLGVVSSKQMLSGWKFVLLGSAIVGAVLTPSTDPLTQSLLGGAMVTLYFGGIGLVKLLGK